MLGVDDSRAKLSKVVLRKPAANERHVPGAGTETGGRAVEWNESLAPFDKPDERGLLVRGHCRMVGIHDKAVVGGEGIWIEVAKFLGVFEIDAALGQDRLQLLESCRRLMMSLVAKEQH